MEKNYKYFLGGITFARMVLKNITAVEAVLDFEANIWPFLWPGERNGTNRDYNRCVKVIQAARDGKVSEGRARLMLEDFGGGRYRVGVTFQIVEEMANGPAFKEGLKKLWQIKDDE